MILKAHCISSPDFVVYFFQVLYVLFGIQESVKFLYVAKK